MDFFDDDATSPPPTSDSPASRAPRRRPDRRRTRIQRIVVLAAILFVAVFGLAWWARSCQHSRKVSSYRTYFEGVTAAINDSATLGKQLNQLINNPTRYSRKQLMARLQDLSAKQDEIAARADRLTEPTTLAVEQAEFAEGMRVRADGFKQFDVTMLGILANKQVHADTLASFAGYFSGPDAYYMSRIYVPARNTLSQQGVTGVTVPTATYYLGTHMFDLPRLQAMVSSITSSTKLSGVHGVGLVSVTAQPGDVTLAKGATASVTATANLAFDVKVKNTGDATERNVKVTAQLTLPGGGGVLTQTGSIATIPAGQTQSVTIQGFAVPAEALSKVSTLKVTAGPVQGEKVLSNNSGTYKILLQLQ